MKLVGIQPANQAKGLPIIQGIYVLFDMRVGQPVALFDGAALTTLVHSSVGSVGPARTSDEGAA